jgi:hypothetical protein
MVADGSENQSASDVYIELYKIFVDSAKTEEQNPRPHANEHATA